MSRRKRTSLIEDLIQIASLLPYWVSLIIAVVAYFLFNSFATADLQLSTKAGSAIPQNMSGIIFKTFSSVLQYVVPLAFVFGAIVSGFKSFQARTQAKRYEEWSPAVSFSNKRPAKPTDDMSWSQFELLVGEAFRKKGFRVAHGGDAGADGGIDVRLYKNGKQYLVQCKHWKTKRVGVAVIREFYGAMVSSGVAGGFVVTSGEFTEEAESFSGGKPLKLINGDGLARLLGRKLQVNSGDTSADKTDTVSCPKCGSAMVKRVAKRGQNAGNEFLGCSQFPKCKGIRSL